MSIKKSRLIYIAVTVIFMVRTLHNMLQGSRPIDWIMLVIEGLVLIVILYEVISGELRRRKENRIRSFLDARIVELSRSRDEGEILLSVVPNYHLQSRDKDRMIPWTGSVEAWTERTEKMLSRYSDRVASEFVNVEPRTDTNFGLTNPHISFGGQSFKPYDCLVIRLEILRRILERPEAYFKGVVKTKALSVH